MHIMLLRFYFYNIPGILGKLAEVGFLELCDYITDRVDRMALETIIGVFHAYVNRLGMDLILRFKDLWVHKLRIIIA